MCNRLLWLVCLVVVLALGSGARAAVLFSDDFEGMHEFLSDGPGAYSGILNVETISMLNSSLIQPGSLYIESAGASWDPGPGPMLYVEVAGDFVASVKVVDYASTEDAYVFYNNCGLVARAIPADANDADDWIAMDYFPLYGVGNIVRYAVDGVRSENVGGNGLAFNADPYLQIERVGNTFYLRTSPDGETWIDYPAPDFAAIERPDLDGQPVQVGLAQCTFTPNSGYAAFDDFSIEVPDPPLAKIIWVSDNLGYDFAAGQPAEQGFIDLLTSAGYEVDFKGQYDPHVEGDDDTIVNPEWTYWRELDPNKIAELNAADLVIIGRNASSGCYDDGNEPNEWNAVTTPTIMLSAHIARSNKWGWLNGTSTGYSNEVMADVADLNHPIFIGVTVDANDQVEVFTPDYNVDIVAGVTDAGNGTVLATRPDTNAVSIATWETGQVYFEGSARVAGGRRMFFAAGSGSKSNTSDGMYNLTADGELMFLNAVAYMLAAPPAVHSYTFEDGTANDSAGDADGVLVGGAEVVDGALVTTAQDQWMEMPGDVIAMNAYSAVTVEAWYTPTAGANAGWSMLAAFGDTRLHPDNWEAGYDYFFITSARDDDKSRAAISTIPGDPWAVESGADGPEYDDGLLHHMVSTIDGTEITLYIDGVLVSSTPLAEGNAISGISQNHAYLAKGVYPGDPEWIGAIQEFNIYNQALSADHIAALFEEGL